MNDIILVVMYSLGAALVSYLLGSISFAVIFSKIFAKKDVRESGSVTPMIWGAVVSAGPWGWVETGAWSCACAPVVSGGWVEAVSG